MTRFDEEYEDPHGECRHEIHRLIALNSSLTDKSNSYIVENAKLTAERDALRGLMIKFAADVLKLRTWGEPIPFRLSDPFDEEVRLLAIRISDAARKDAP